MGEREDMLAAVRERVDRVTATGDGSAVLDPAAAALSQSLAAVCDAGSGADPEAEYALGWLYHHRAQCLPPEQATANREIAVRLFAWCFVKGTRDIGELPQPLLAPLAEAVLPFAASTLERARADMDPAGQELAETLYRRMIACLPEGDPERALCLSHLSIALLLRYGRTLAVADADEAVAAARTAVRAAAPHPPLSAASLNNLGLVLRTRFEHTGVLADLDAAVDALRDAVATAADDAPGRAGSLLQLSRALEVRYENAGALTDLDEAVETARTALRVAPDHPDRSSHLAALGGALAMRYQRTEVLADLDEAVQTGRAALRCVPEGWPHVAPHFSSLAATLLTRFERTAVRADLDEAVELGRAAVRSLPACYPAADHALYLSALARTLLVRADHAATVPGDLDATVTGDLDEAVAALGAAVDRTRDDHLHRTAYRTHLGGALLQRAKVSGDVQDQEKALAELRQVTEHVATPPRIRVATARTVAQLTAASDPIRAAELLERAVMMLPEVAPRRLGRGDRQHALGTLAAGLAADAAALALADTSVTAPDRPVRALRLVEGGRAVLLSQALDTRSDLTDLRKLHPGLAARFVELREALDRDIEPVPSTGGGPAGDGGERHQLATELSALLERIRSCEGFAGFGAPPGLDELLAEAVHGPVVTFTVSCHRSDGLLLTTDGVFSCPLPRLTEEAVLHQAESFYRALEDATAPDRDRVAAQGTLRGVLEWLWEAAAEPVLTALEALGHVPPPAHDGDELPRVWWAPGGLLSLLPLHAAGFHTDTDTDTDTDTGTGSGSGARRRTVMDRVVSSYTPTIRMLHHARRPRPTATGDVRSLVVAVPDAPGLPLLPHVAEEARRVRALLPHPIDFTAPEPPDERPGAAPGGEALTTAAVLARLPECAIVHFACHGVTDHMDPSQSRLLLQDHETAPLTVSALASADLDHARLAYLSACSTATPGGPTLLEEAIHLTSALRVAGFPHVVGTLWPVDDRMAAEIAESFYQHLLTGAATGSADSVPDPDRAAVALHHAVRAARDCYPATPSLWAAHLHSGR
ncbi:CHAT domain-containing protein [Streptomyces sp. NPDC093094]|uniref:CHAT domain-containing protein n=1 Tax=Streptomyces sp. NPDC093094 TaxID=3366026 RepID=UPI0037FAF5D2